MSAEIAPRERAFWLAVSQISGIGPVRLLALFERFGSLQQVWTASPRELATVLDSRTLDQLMQARGRVGPEELLGSTERQGISVVTLLDADYPRALAQIAAAPPVLYVRGTLRPEDDVAVAFVGTRKSTAVGRQITEEIAGELASSGVTIVSGLARGIDGAAHQGALSRGGRTIAVLASGVDIIYPPEHRVLAQRITESGALVSDYPPGTKPDPAKFPARNRLISGLALGTVVVEAPRRSGALITVDFAADQGREVFVVPSGPSSAAGEGSNRLLRDGARAVMCAGDILEDLGLVSADVTEESAVPVHLSDDERRLMAVIGSEPRHMDEIVVAAGLTIAQGSAMMTMLELQGLVRNVGSQHYVAMRGAGRASR